MSGLITRRSVFQLLTLPLAGCAAQGARYTPNSLVGATNSGTIYVYRPLTELGRRGEDPFISMAHKSYGRMRAGRLIAGDVSRRARWTSRFQQSLLFLVPTIPKTVTVSVVRGSQSYVRVDQVIDAIGVTEGASVTQSIEIEEMPFNVGQAELAQTRQNI